MIDRAGRGIEVEQRHGDGDGGEEPLPHQPAKLLDAALLLLDQFLDLAMLLVTQQLGLAPSSSLPPQWETGLPGREPRPLSFAVTTA